MTRRAAGPSHGTAIALLGRQPCWRAPRMPLVTPHPPFHRCENPVLLLHGFLATPRAVSASHLRHSRSPPTFIFCLPRRLLIFSATLRCSVLSEERNRNLDAGSEMDNRFRERPSRAPFVKGGRKRRLARLPACRRAVSLLRQRASLHEISAIPGCRHMSPHFRESVCHWLDPARPVALDHVESCRGSLDAITAQTSR